MAQQETKEIEIQTDADMELQTLRAQVRALNSSLEMISSRVDLEKSTISSQLTTKQAEYDELFILKEKLHSENTKLILNLEKTQSDLLDKVTLYEELQTTYYKVQKSVQDQLDSQNELDTIQQEKLELEKNYFECQETLNQLQINVTELEKNSKQFDHLVKEKQALEESIKTLKESLESLSLEKMSLKQEYQEMLLKEKQEYQENSLKESKEWDVKILDLQEKLNLSLIQSDELTCQNQELQEKLSLLSKDFEKEKGKEMESLKQSHLQSIQSMESELHQLQKDKTCIEKDLESILTLKESEKEKLKVCQIEIQELQTRISQMTSQHEEELEAAESKLEYLLEKFDALEERCFTLEKDYKEAQLVISELRK